jgi:hypothetical protein
MSEGAGIEPRTGATVAWTAIRCNHSARSQRSSNLQVKKIKKFWRDLNMTNGFLIYDKVFALPQRWLIARSLLNAMISYILCTAEISCFKLSQIIKFVLTEDGPKLFQGITINPWTAKSSTDVPLCPKLSSCSKLRLIIMFHALQYILELFVNQYYILFDARLELCTEHIAFQVSNAQAVLEYCIATLLRLRSFTLLYIKQFFKKSMINKTAFFYKRSKLLIMHFQGARPVFQWSSYHLFFMFPS